MDPLIEIKTVPIEIQMKVTRAHLEYARGTAQVEISRDKGGLNIRSQPIQVNLDTFEAATPSYPLPPPSSVSRPRPVCRVPTRPPPSWPRRAG